MGSACLYCPDTGTIWPSCTCVCAREIEEQAQRSVDAEEHSRRGDVTTAHAQLPEHAQSAAISQADST